MMIRPLINIDRKSSAYISDYLAKCSDLLTEYFFKSNPSVVLWSLQGLENRIIAAVDDLRKIIYIQADNPKIIDLFMQNFAKVNPLNSYRIDIPENLISYLNYHNIPKDFIEVYSILQYTEDLAPGTGRPVGTTKIIRNSKGIPMEAIICQNNQTLACSSVFWLSDNAAEISIECLNCQQGADFLINVLSAHSYELNKIGIIPIYLVSETNFHSRRLAEKVGFVDTGKRLIEINGFSNWRTIC
ncbi:MAG: hypothetical protein APR63_07620 [Desulfuromonas sp. SDB]|nr:MAG: hypothetical protein APR63_07620 [Desulfuromonas sp. SDB]